MMTPNARAICVAVAGIMAAATGCSGKLFRPEVPRAVVDPEAEMRVKSLYVTRFPGVGFDDLLGLRLSLDVVRSPGVSLGEIKLTSARVAPCASGLKSKTVVWTGEVGEPEDLTISFSRGDAIAAGIFADRSAALDLALFPPDPGAPGRCLRIPLVEAAPTGDQWVHHAFLIGGEERLMFLHSSLPRLRTPGLILGVGMGAWSGRWRWMLEGEGGFAGRADPTTNQSGDGRLFGLWGGGASVSTLVFARGRLGLGVLGGYELLRGASSGALDASGASPPSLLLHGPRLGFRVLFLVDPLAWSGFRSPPDAFDGGITVYVGNWWNGIDVLHPSPFVGVSLEGNLGF